jgi:hypothetical protein
MSVLMLSAHLTSVQKRQTSSFVEELQVTVIAFHFYKYDTKYLDFNYRKLL